jgi:anaerobic magnesium-protoporphyrin IX monomethyl ester cyclase
LFGAEFTLHFNQKQTAKSKYVDIVVRGEGDLVVKKLADRLVAEKPLGDVEGITFKADGRIKSNHDAPLIDLDNIPLDLPFDLLLLDKYPSLKNGRFHIQTSRGCPHSCGFCYNLTYNKRRWSGKSSKRVIEEIEYVLKRFPETKIIDIIDDNFFVDKKRVEEICQQIINRKLDLTWRASCRFDYLSAYDRVCQSFREIRLH